MANQILKEKINLTINVEIIIVEEGKYYVAYCPALELSAYGDTQEKAMKAFDKEVHIFLEETHKRGTLEKYLLRNGWVLQQIPELNYEPPRPNTENLFDLFKSGKSLIKQDIQIPVC